MTTPYPLLLEPAALAAALDDPALLIVDLCQEQHWQRLHLPGAVHVNPTALLCGVPPAPGKLPEPAQLAALFSAIGYTPDRHLVAYDDEGGGWAGRFLWTLDVIGHTRHSYLNGGLHSWLKEGHPITTAIVTPQPTAVELNLHEDPIADRQTVMDALGRDDVGLWDARSREEYLGLRSGSRRAGHIPGAVNIDWLELMDHARNLRLLPADQLRAKLTAAGIAPEQRIITYCQSHHRSGLSYLAAKSLGQRVQAYPGAWGEWGNLPDTPIEVLA
ncbi:MAG TPA: rhodanese-like domain-containing protein [Hyphomicrobiales bacterium]|nr:rhodanese-like domain-containing protein [Hyphomicrobiales bacterium]